MHQYIFNACFSSFFIILGILCRRLLKLDPFDRYVTGIEPPCGIHFFLRVGGSGDRDWVLKNDEHVGNARKKNKKTSKTLDPLVRSLIFIIFPIKMAISMMCLPMSRSRLMVPCLSKGWKLLRSQVSPFFIAEEMCGCRVRSIKRSIEKNRCRSKTRTDFNIF